MNKENKLESILSQSVLNAMGEDHKPEILTKSKLSSLKERVMIRAFSACPEGGETARNAEIDWVYVTDNIDIKVLSEDLENKVQTAYWRIKPGTIIPSHFHETDEDCLVLEGEVRFGEHVLFEGDFHIMKKGTTHPEMHTVSGALLYLRHDIHENLDWLEA